MKESEFQAELIRDIREIYPDAIVLKTDPTYIQGFPDLLILWEDRWAALEVKRTYKAHVQPNQRYYVDKLNSMSFASFICPETKESVLDELQRAWEA